VRCVHPIAVSVFVLASCGGSAGRVSNPIAGMPSAQQRTVSRLDFQDEWPFTAGEGTLACQDGAVAFRAGNTTYALNEAARARGYASIEPLRVTQSAAPTNPLRRVRQDQRTQIFGELASCKTAGNVLECRRRVADRHGLSPDEAQQIDVEGNERRWPPLTPQRMSIQKVVDAGLALCRH